MKTYNTDDTMKETWCHLAADFRALLNTASYAKDKESLLLESVAGFRASGFPGRMAASPKLFKCDYQLEALFKRYRFENDAYSESELRSMSWKKFLDTQCRLAQGVSETPLLNKVIREARVIAKEILGDYDPEEHANLCAFGKRACVGTRYIDSNLHIKLSKPITGSQKHIWWFKQHLKGDALLREAILDAQNRKRVLYKVCQSLTLTLVPKSYKSLRSIMPDTLIGSFYTRGLGRVLALRLKRVGLDIRHLQSVHGIKAEKSSKTLVNVTADLSAASDSISLWLLRRVLPDKWFKVLLFGRIPHINYEGATVRMQTILTMGLGHTFPLQTLIFYSLTESIRRIMNVRGKCSVYGDDLIYPRGIHKLVSYVFPRVYLQLNTDKTYANVHFRESCGSDYYRGVAVRPFCPEGQHQRLTGLQYAQFLYKLYNGLLRRWEYREIPLTLNYIYALIVRRCGECFVVPPHFPDDAGLKFAPMVPLRYTELIYDQSYQSCKYEFLRIVTGRRKVESQICYYWEWLRNRYSEEPLDPYTELSDVPSLHWARKIRYKKGVRSVTLIPFTVDKRQKVVTKSCAVCDSFYASPSLRI